MKTGQLPEVELAPELAQAYMDTFINRTSMYPYQLHDGTYVSIQMPLNQR